MRDYWLVMILFKIDKVTVFSDIRVKVLKKKLYTYDNRKQNELKNFKVLRNNY